MSRPPRPPTSPKPSAWALGGMGGCQLQARLVSEARVPSWGGCLESVSLCRQVAPLGWGGAPVSTMGRRLGVQRQVIVLLEKALPPAQLRMLRGRLEGSSAKAERTPWRLQVLRQVLDPVWPPPSSGDSHWRPQSTSNVTQQVTRDNARPHHHAGPIGAFCCICEVTTLSPENWPGCPLAEGLLCISQTQLHHVCHNNSETQTTLPPPLAAA